MLPADGELRTGAGGEGRGDGEPVPTDQRLPPLHRHPAGAGGPVDRQQGDVSVDAEHPAVGGGRHDCADLLLTAVQAHRAPGGQLLVQGGVGEVGVQERRGHGGGQPHPVHRQRLTVGQPQPLEEEQRGRLLQPHRAATTPSAVSCWRRTSLR